MIVQWPDTDLISSDEDFSQTFSMVKLEQDKGELTLDFSVEQFVELFNVIGKLLIKFGNG